MAKDADFWKLERGGLLGFEAEAAGQVDHATRVTFDAGEEKERPVCCRRTIGGWTPVLDPQVGNEGLAREPAGAGSGHGFTVAVDAQGNHAPASTRLTRWKIIPARANTLACVALALQFLAGCSSSVTDVHDEVSTTRTSKQQASMMDCTLTPQQCEIIRRGIDHLLNHSNGMCRAMGEHAQSRFDDTRGLGFRPAPQVPGNDMGVETVRQGSNTPANGYTNVYPSFWHGNTTPEATGGLLAHEEVHHLGFGESAGESMQNMCNH